MNGQMRVKEFLEQGLMINKKIELKKMAIANLELINRQFSTKTGADYGTALDKLWEGYVKEITRLLVIKYEIGEKIAAVPDENCRMVLEARYVACMKWEQVAELMYFSLMHVHRLAREGISALETLSGESRENLEAEITKNM